MNVILSANLCVHTGSMTNMPFHKVTCTERRAMHVSTAYEFKDIMMASLCLHIIVSITMFSMLMKVFRVQA